MLHSYLPGIDSWQLSILLMLEIFKGIGSKEVCSTVQITIRKEIEEMMACSASRIISDEQ
jgi:hypothetical protein